MTMLAERSVTYTMMERFLHKAITTVIFLSLWPTMGMTKDLIKIEGSSTVYPITRQFAQQFMAQQEEVAQIVVGVTGTGGGFRKFCRGKTDISNASRPIKTQEKALCRENGIEFLELPIALDAVTLVVSKDNHWLKRLSLKELATLWHSSSEKTITHWNQLNSNFPAEPVKLYAPGSDSGTYDYFTNVVLNGDELRGDYIANEDDYLLASKVATDPNALAFLGFAYYQNNQTQLKAVSITNHKHQAIAPSINSVTSGQYSSLSRPLFIYVNKAAVNRHSVNQFIEHYLNQKHLSYVVSTAGYIPLSPKMQSAAQSIFEDQTIGSVFNSKELSTNFEHFMERK